MELARGKARDRYCGATGPRVPRRVHQLDLVPSVRQRRRSSDGGDAECAAHRTISAVPANALWPSLDASWTFRSCHSAPLELDRDGTPNLRSRDGIGRKRLFSMGGRAMRSWTSSCFRRTGSKTLHCGCRSWAAPMPIPATSNERGSSTVRYLRWTARNSLSSGI